MAGSAPILVIPLMVAMLVACRVIPFGDPAPIADLGVRRSPDGAVEAAYRPCTTTGLLRVSDIRLFRTGGKIGRADDELLWQLQAEPPMNVEDFLIGGEPEGFRTLKTLVSLPDTWLVLDLTDRYGYTTSVSFRLKELRTDKFLTGGGKSVPPDSFNAHAHCR